MASEDELQAGLERAADRLARATSVLALTGAGISVASGLRPYRGPDGLWESGELDPMEVASVQALEQHPERVAGYLHELRARVERASPNAAHEALVRLEQRYPHFALVTQNVDGLHARAGSQRLFELHGSLLRNRSFQGIELPAVVLFGGMLPLGVVSGIEHFLTTTPPEVLLVIGTTALFPHIREWISRARRKGGFVVEINVCLTELTGSLADLFLEGKAEELLPRLVQLVEQQAS